MKWLQKIMLGRNGGDQLCMGLLLLGLITTIIGNILKLPIINYLSYIPIILCIYRMYSKDLTKRRMENYKFMILISPLYSWFSVKVSKIKSKKSYKYFKCPNCKQELRLPKGKGKINITCSKCSTKFMKKT
ncbi:hypothetical protein GC105_08435 [Alkalibaculum sp. M08DMB]|uniref:Zn-finger containing protein n=1 Tax=Alkalibaculum sporogenes TaxID=2655001 RepID=A0A6A7K8X5_9FIRM|nr:hypothetical protein [Alkalibaculum sporogenes]